MFAEAERYKKEAGRLYPAMEVPTESKEELEKNLNEAVIQLEEAEEISLESYLLFWEANLKLEKRLDY